MCSAQLGATNSRLRAVANLAALPAAVARTEELVPRAFRAAWERAPPPTAVSYTELRTPLCAFPTAGELAASESGMNCTVRRPLGGHIRTILESTTLWSIVV